MAAFSIDNDDLPWINRPAPILGWVVSFYVLAFFAVILRMYIRLRVAKCPGWDDLFICLAAVTATSATICVGTATTAGLGRHFLTLTFAQMRSYLKSFYIANASYCMSTTLIKSSLLCQYLRIFKAGILRIVCIGLLVFVLLWGFAYSFMAWFPCFPVKAFWDYAIRDAKCYGFGSINGSKQNPAQFVATYDSHTAINMVLDATILLIPMSLYFKEDTKKKQLWGITTLFFLGAIINVTSIWRLVTIVHNRAATYPTIDPTFYSPISVVLACLEVSIAMVCASIPIFWPIIQENVGKIFVTQVIEVHDEPRVPQIVDDRDSLSLKGASKGYELEDGGALGRYDTPAGKVMGHNRNMNGSQSSMESLRALNRKYSSAELHYQDPYIADQVDPWNPRAVPPAVETNVQGPKKNRFWGIP